MQQPGKSFNPQVLTLPITTIVFLAAWQLIVTGLSIPYYILPTPAQMFQAVWRGITANPLTASSLLYHMGITLRAAMLGYIVGCIGGIVLGILIAENKMLERILLPYAVALQSLPKVAIAPLVMIWFGFGLTSKVVLASLLTFFPLLINTHTGLSLVDRDYLVLMRALKASRWQTLWKVKLPFALPMIFAGLDLSTVYSVLGAVVGEFVAGTAGIGIAILQYQYISDTAGVFAALIVLGISCIALHSIVRWVQKRVVFWSTSSDQQKVTATA